MIMSNYKSDASQDIRDTVANIDPDIRKRIDDSLAVVIPYSHRLKPDGQNVTGVVHGSENVIKTVKAAPFLTIEQDGISSDMYIEIIDNNIFINDVKGSGEVLVSIDNWDSLNESVSELILRHKNN